MLSTPVREIAYQAGYGHDEGPGGLDRILEGTVRLTVLKCIAMMNQEALLTDHVSAEMNLYAGKRLKNAALKIEDHFFGEN